MVFIAVGTQRQQFSRLFKIVDNSKMLSKKEIIAQAGFTKYNSNKITMLDFISQEQLDDYIEKSEFVICHGGVGTIFSCLAKKKKVLVVPRLKKYKEHKNDHQLEICKQLQKEGYILFLEENEDIDKKLQELEKKKFKIYKNDAKYLEILKKVI